MSALLLALLLPTAATWEAAAQERAPVHYPAVIPPDQPITEGQIRVQTADGVGTMVLTHLDVHAEVRAGLARVTVEQVFDNPYDEALEAVYMFPLPQDAAVDAMEMRVGDRTIQAELERKDEAREDYERARASGQRAALLEQERPNLFTQNITGLCPGERIAVTLSYVHEVELDNGVYRLDFPMTVGPRFAPADRVPDADRVTGPTMRDGRTVTLSVAIDEGIPVQGLWSDTHDLDVLDEDARGVDLALASADELPNKDFSLEWTLATDEPVASLLAHRPDADSEGYLALRVEPQLLEDIALERPRELVFVIDQSGSMRGEPYETAREAVLQALDGMGPHDSFNLVRFSDASSSLFLVSQPVTAANRAAAEQWLTDFRGGGTVMEEGIRHSLNLPRRPAVDGVDPMRLVLLLTDGWIGQEDTVFAVARENLGDSRIFALGIGHAPNRWLLQGLSELGQGAVVQADPEEPLEDTVDAFLARISHPAMTDVEVDWGALSVTEQYPAELPDLWAGRTLTVSGRYDLPPSLGDVPTTVTLRGLVDGEPFALEVPVEAPALSNENPEVATLWARRAIHDGTLWAWGKPDEDTVEELTWVALDHGIVSDWTALVAVDEEEGACEVERTVEVPQLAVEGSEYSKGLAENAGVLGSLQGGIGGLIGAKGVQIGSGGLGARGQGFGGGGTASGLAGLGTKGQGSGASGYGIGTVSAKQDGAISQIGADPIILGSLDKSLIDAVIKRHMNQVRYCYQRELQKKPDLAGRVVVRFVVAADGSVSLAEIKRSTLGSEAVEQCLTGRFQRMRFPQPAGGGVVVVSYPFIFKSE